MCVAAKRAATSVQASFCEPGGCRKCAVGRLRSGCPAMTGVKLSWQAGQVQEHWWLTTSLSWMYRGSPVSPSCAHFKGTSGAAGVLGSGGASLLSTCHTVTNFSNFTIHDRHLQAVSVGTPETSISDLDVVTRSNA